LFLAINQLNTTKQDTHLHIKNKGAKKWDFNINQAFATSAMKTEKQKDQALIIFFILFYLFLQQAYG